MLPKGGTQVPVRGVFGHSCRLGRLVSAVSNSMNYPLVSIVIPCFNAERFIGDAIRSALSQTYVNKEILVIDDGSTDRSSDIIKSFGESIRWEGVSNQGACAARNRGIRLARGPLIQFLDADDLLMPVKLERQVPHALSAGRNTLSICHGVTSNGNTYLDWQYERQYDSERDPIDFVLGGVIPTSASLHHRENLLAIGGFDESLPCAQEFDLHLRLVSSGLQLAQLREVMFVVNQQPGSVSSDSMKVVRQKLYILRKATELLQLRDALTIHRSRSLAVAYSRSATTLELRGFSREAKACRSEALALWPNAEVCAWTPRWRPLVRTFGSVRTARFRLWVKNLRGALSR